MVVMKDDKGDLVQSEPGTGATFRELALSVKRQSISAEQPTQEAIAAQTEQFALGKTGRKVSCDTEPDGCTVCCGNIICCATCPGSDSITCCGPVNCTDYPKKIMR
jgi:hypothetical protein